MGYRTLSAVGLTALFFVLATYIFAQAAQGGQRGGAPAPPPGKATAPIDLVGYWVALVTEDWR